MRKAVVCLVLFWFILGLGFVAAQEKSPESVKQGAVTEAKKEAEAWQEKISAEAAEAVTLTMKALALLEQNKKEEALKAIEQALGKLDVALAVNKDLSSVPVDVDVVVTDVVADISFLQKNLKEVKKLLNKGYIQEARRLLNTLQSEVDIIIQELPLSSYPPALRLAARYIREGKIEEAQDVLHLALSSLLVREIVIPLPLVRAEDLILQADKVAKDKPEKAIEYLKEAKKQLKVAEVLGYAAGEKGRYHELQRLLKETIEKLQAKEHPKEHFKRLKNLLHKLRAKV